MSRFDQLKENYEDKIFEVLMDSLVAQLGASYREEITRLEKDPDAAVPEHVDKRCRKTIRRKSAGGTGRRLSARVVLQRIIVAVLLLSLMTTAAVAAVPEVRVWFDKVVVRRYDDHTEFSYTRSGEIPEYLEIDPQWIPEGYELVQDERANNWCMQYYVKGDSNTIYMEKLSTKGRNDTLDTEDAVLEDVTIQGYTGTLATKEGEAWLLVPIPEWGYTVWICVEGELTVDDLLKIAENTRFV